MRVLGLIMKEAHDMCKAWTTQHEALCLEVAYSGMGSCSLFHEQKLTF